MTRVAALMSAFAYKEPHLFSRAWLRVCSTVSICPSIYLCVRGGLQEWGSLFPSHMKSCVNCPTSDMTNKNKHLSERSERLSWLHSLPILSLTLTGSKETTKQKQICIMMVFMLSRLQGQVAVGWRWRQAKRFLEFSRGSWCGILTA